jgi:hypothetical protein
MARQEGGYSHEWSCIRLHFQPIVKIFLDDHASPLNFQNVFYAPSELFKWRA